MAKQTNLDNLLNVATGKESVKVGADAETLKQVQQSTYLITGALVFLGIAIISRSK